MILNIDREPQGVWLWVPVTITLVTTTIYLVLIPRRRLPDFRNPGRQASLDNDSSLGALTA